MKFITPILASIICTASAAPFQLLSKRQLTAGDINSPTGCPRTLAPNQFEFPHYITQVSRSQPNKTTGTQYNGSVTPNDIATIYSFDVPSSRRSANCTIEFLFPKQPQLRTSSYTYRGNGTFFFKAYRPGSCLGPQTSYSNQPRPLSRPQAPLGPIQTFHMEPGFAYTIDVGPCAAAAGTCVAGMLWSNDTSFSYFQDYDTCPIGLYMTYSYGLPPRTPTRGV